MLASALDGEDDEMTDKEMLSFLKNMQASIELRWKE
jgi:hypothetical protein